MVLNNVKKLIAVIMGSFIFAASVTENSKEIKKAILNRLKRGATVFPVHGAFSEQGKEMLLTVISRYELYELRKIILEIDPSAFTNVVQTDSIIGHFRKT
ncbi:YitT family protein [Pallidibacillus pasinlerensis]|uniref:YitT family protein n=1 Tax=Pallidibacillus pasinlerensis TaxID=2703818 RepID=A0ABX0A5X4_9BACI|nr:YitT family protein [Pallidibacillus pasinlerensis]NCU16583.1 YitT family protein [Pallidibacillus pasinlerensis]